MSPCWVVSVENLYLKVYVSFSHVPMAAWIWITIKMLHSLPQMRARVMHLGMFVCLMVVCFTVENSYVNNKLHLNCILDKRLIV